LLESRRGPGKKRLGKEKRLLLLGESERRSRKIPENVTESAHTEKNRSRGKEETLRTGRKKPATCHRRDCTAYRKKKKKGKLNGGKKPSLLKNEKGNPMDLNCRKENAQGVLLRGGKGPTRSSRKREGSQLGNRHVFGKKKEKKIREKGPPMARGGGGGLCRAFPVTRPAALPKRAGGGADVRSRLDTAGGEKIKKRRLPNRVRPRTR